MYRNYFLALFILFGLLFAKAQDSLQRGFIKYISQPSGDAMVKKDIKKELHFNSEKTLFFSNKFSMLDGQEVKASFSEKGFGYQALSADEKGFQIYRNFIAKEIFFRIPETIPLDPYTVEDNWIELDWEIIERSNKIILGYSCKKAMGEFRERTYQVWFTKEIRLPYGSWKLFGLPGLILEATDTSGNFKFIAQEVCYPCDSNVKIEKIIEKEHKTLREFVYYNDHILKMAEKSMKAILDFIRKTRDNFDIQINLNNLPTELEIQQKRKDRIEVSYEWENEKPIENFKN